MTHLGPDCTQGPGFTVQHTLEVPSGVTDAKLRGNVVVLGKSTGSAAVYHIAPPSAADGEEETLSFLGETGLEDGQDCLYLSVDWSAADGDGGGVFCASKANGEVSAFALGDGGDVAELSTWDAHTFMGCAAEVWIVACSRKDENALVTGADDGMLKLWDLRMVPTPAATVKGVHEAGVTTAQWHPVRAHLFATGSYDQRVRLWDARSMRRPLQTTEAPGGVWRVKWRPPESAGRDLLLVAAMHGGACVLDPAVGDDVVGTLAAAGGESGGEQDDLSYLKKDGASILTTFSQHESMAYGVDWCVAAGERERPLFASCSFYDKLLCAWELQA
uniref:methylated diphthine methylhydrolase n=1 Tax=Phaeomonas parva TaxID=124430 RepID=A0A7S1UJ84_9STRA|mmetsp:Transcript_6426/g.18132  ORF Transcript_6426/g.18132 Transcript_6426/m.18132 type:complete len:331 (+) Transcript_6426:266-1258(+)